MLVAERHIYHVHTPNVPHTVYVFVGGSLATGRRIVGGFVDNAIGGKRGINHSHDATLAFLIEILETDMDIVVESGFQ